MAQEATLTIEELRSELGQTFAKVHYGRKTFIVTKHGEPLGKIVPLDSEASAAPAKAKRRKAP